MSNKENNLEKPVLSDKEVYPDEAVLRNALGQCYPVFEELKGKLNMSDHPVVSNWKYYNDGKSWLLRTEHKKKTLFWLSVWNGYFKISFYFTEKNVQCIKSLEIDESIIENFMKARPVGRLFPLILDVRRREQLNDILTILSYKLKLK